MLAKYITVSSANLITFECTRHSEKSLKLIKNKSGPKMDPCGTPHVTGFFCDSSLS